MIAVYKEICKVDVLAVGIHPDDVELSASGTLLSHKAQGCSIGICDLTKGELGSRGSAAIRIEESKVKSHILKIAEVIRLARPKIILANALDDRHPDHPRGAHLVREAFFFSGLSRITSIQGKAYRADALYHYIQDKQLEPDLCVDVSAHFETKMKSIRAFKTQFYQGSESEGDQTPISSKDFIDFMESKMRVFGRNIGAKYAEGFNVHRTIGIKNLLHLQ